MGTSTVWEDVAVGDRVMRVTKRAEVGCKTRQEVAWDEHQNTANRENTC